jgi:hypothetical protein
MADMIRKYDTQEKTEDDFRETNLERGYKNKLNSVAWVR